VLFETLDYIILHRMYFYCFFLFRTVLNSVHDKMILSLQLSCLCAIEFTVGVRVCEDRVVFRTFTSNDS
jgi:hypothetical protein